jgi:hypothetical protein
VDYNPDRCSKGERQCELSAPYRSEGTRNDNSGEEEECVLCKAESEEVHTGSDAPVDSNLVAVKFIDHHKCRH